MYMKYSFLLMVIGLFVLSLGSVLALEAACNPKVILLNQDPYPAMPGESAKVVFQIQGVENPNCKNIDFELLEEYPIKIDPNYNKVVSISSSTYTSNDFSPSAVVPYRIIVDSQAINEEVPIYTRITYLSSSVVSSFNLTIQDVTTDFEVSIKDYDPVSNTVTFDIINVGENNVEALAVDIETQDNFAVRGSTRNIVGSLDSNDDTTFTFEGVPREGKIDMSISYTDPIDERRQLQKNVIFNPQLYEGRGEQKNNSTIWIVVLIIVVVIVIFWLRSRSKKKKAERMKHHTH